MSRPDVDIAQAERFLTLLDEGAETWHFRTFPEGGGAGHNRSGSLGNVATSLRLDNGNGRGVYTVVNEGGHDTASITRVRAVFADFDPPQTEAMPARFPLEPHVIVESSPGKHHVYWLVDGLRLNEFKATQKAIAAMLGSDPAVCDLPRVMRLPGFIHAKAAPFQSRIIHEAGTLPYSADTIRAAFPVAPVPERVAAAPGAAVGAGERVVDTDRHADMLKLAARLARQVHFDGMAEASAWAALQAEAERGRWTRDMDAAEIKRAFDGALAKCRKGEWRTADQPEPADDEGPSWAELLAAQLLPWTEAELEASREPHPHVFSAGERGMFPVGEVSVIGARGREGKTTVMVAVATALVIEHSLAGLWPMKGRSALIYSAEDDRRQYARKVAAQRALLPPGQAEQLMGRIIVPNLDTPGMERLRRLVTEAERKPIATGTDEAIIQAVEPLMASDYPPALLIFETVATLTEADEDNRAFSVLTDCLKRVARTLNVAVALVHHTSQAADSTLADLSISTIAIRGGTALIANSRQNLLLLSLGSDDDPFPDNDGRTVLRAMVAPEQRERITALIAMETSKGIDPAPVWFRWQRTDYGPAAVEHDPPLMIEGKSWRKVREMTMAERANKRAEGKQSAKEQATDIAMRAVRELEAEDKPATVRAVSIKAGRSDTWAKPYLEQAAADGLLLATLEVVPRGKAKTTVYRLPNDSTEMAA